MANHRQEKLNRSFKKDAARWVESYTNHTATALQKRVIEYHAAANGHSNLPILRPPS